ncbi:Crp/Fnr family transcriptional regulator [Xanthovirga aplysinae]|uniref:Crp/Fnr family transcriptional regulator n=1 Tax=Xanthovirga aplysinae TaxID=2529853 RepID=UPI0012BC2F44|nr:Crp/Fnr family transcriptional regulator [Xanthovirga aplysinae]MTI30103.1 Crp/Fnr family transcriptional regulator [Xanthovirga aplysinae]
MIKKSLTSLIFKGLAFTQEETKFIDQQFEKIQLKRGELVLGFNENVNHQFYVFSGCLRTFFVDSTGKEHTLQFAIKDWWISDYIAYFNHSKSLLSIECIQDATLYKIAKKDIERIYDRVPSTERFFREKMEKAFVRFQKRILSNLAETATERYLNFLRQYPNIEQKVKNYHIASYLGIATESLSRIRKEIAEE